MAPDEAWIEHLLTKWSSLRISSITSRIPEAWIDCPMVTWRSLLIGTAGFLFVIPLSYAFRYRRSIRRRLQEIEDGFSQNIMVRETEDSLSGGGGGTSTKQKRKDICCLELNPDFVEAHSDQWKLISLGAYMSSLKPRLPDAASNIMLPKFIERELEVTIGSVLLKAFGRRLGGAILPLLGITDVHSKTAGIATSIASWWISHFVIQGKLDTMTDQAALVDAGSLPFNLGEVLAMANLNEKFSSSTMEVKSLEWMRRGEVGYEPSFGQPIPKEKTEDASSRAEKATNKDKDEPEEEMLEQLIPNPFVISLHWSSAIEGLENAMKSRTTIKYHDAPNAEAKESPAGKHYDPGDRSFPDPTPINPRLLPDLHLGWGSAECTHTKREIIRNRLLAVLLNKLSYNFYKKEQKESDFFVAKMCDKTKSKEVIYPHEFVQALLDSGHSIEVCPRAAITSFGLAVCVKEKDETWSNVPIGIFFRSGYERKGDERPAHYIMPHGGMDLRLKGPIVGKDDSGQDRNCDIQFYMAIEGMCGWHSNHNAKVPWLQRTAFTKVYSDKQALLALKLAGILAVTFNALGTEMDLPYGGYGLVGVCNDTAALLDFAVRGETNMFPLVSTGRFLIRSSRRLIQLYENIKAIDGQTQLGDDLRLLITACCKIQSDLQASPSNLISSSKRFLASQPESLCFQLEQESKKIMTDLNKVFGEFDEKKFKLFS